MIVVAVAAKDVHNILPFAQAEPLPPEPLLRGQSWDAMEVGAMRSMFEPEPAYGSFGWSDDLRLLRNFGLSPRRERERKPPEVTASLTKPDVFSPLPQYMPPSAPSWWTYNNGSLTWPGGNGDVQRFLAAGGGPRGGLPDIGTPGGVGGGVGNVPIEGLPGGGVGGGIVYPPVVESPIFVESPGAGVGGPVSVPEPTLVGALAIGLLLARRRSH